jgi:hypothetical protein
MIQHLYSLRTLCTIFLITVCTVIYGQKVIADLGARNQAEDIQCYVQGDSLLVTYLEQIPATSEYTRSAFWIYNNRTDTAALDALGNHLLSGTTRDGSKQYYYYVEEKNKEKSLMAFTGTSPDSTFEVLPKEKITGELLAIISERQLFVITYNRYHEELVVNIIKGKNRVLRLNYKMPFDIAYYYGSSYAIFNPWSLPNPAAGSAEFKIYKSARQIDISIDQAKFGRSSRTEIISLPLVPGAVPMVRQIKGPKRINFRSFLMGDTLYRAAITRARIDFTYYNIESGNTLGALRIMPDDKLENEVITSRLGHLAEVKREEKLSTFVQTSGNFFPSVFAYSNLYRPEVAIGSYILSDNTGTGSGGLGLGRMIGCQYPTSFTVAREPEGVSKYFHLVQRQNGFEFETSENRRSVIDRIDDYELSQVSLYQTAFGSKSYINLEAQVIAIYYLPALKKIVVMSFSK